MLLSQMKGNRFYRLHSLYHGSKDEQDKSYQGEDLNVPTAFKVYGAAVITLKKIK